MFLLLLNSDAVSLTTHSEDRDDRLNAKSVSGDVEMAVILLGI